MGLAGVKKKQRISVDPQNKTWKDDTSKFGYKMLMKMGWEEGKGLGANEDGSTEHLKVEYKADNVGLGVTRKLAAEETYQQLIAFDAVLRRAATTEEGQDQPPSNETKKKDKKEKKEKKEKKDQKDKKDKKDKKASKKRKVESSSDSSSASASSSSDESEEERPAVVVPSRVAHRKKFIRNKQVDAYSERHLREILGTTQ